MGSQIMLQSLPYSQYRQDCRVIEAIIHHQLPGKPQGEDRDISSEDSAAWLVMKYCWDFDPVRRPTCEDVHKYITDNLKDQHVLLRVRTQIPESVAEGSTRSPFWESMRTKSGQKFNFSHLYTLLKAVSGWSSWRGSL